MLILVGGVPAHPLLVHAVVVLLPLAAVGAVVLAVRPAWVRAYGLIVALLALGGAVAASLAVVAGNQLSAAIVTPEFQPTIDQHSSFGMLTVYLGWPFALLAIATWITERRTRPAPTGGTTVVAVATATRALTIVAAVIGVLAVAATVLAGHSGASAVWSGVVGG